MSKGLGLRSIKVEDLRIDEGLREAMKKAALTGSHPKPDLLRAINEIEKEIK